MRSESSLFIAFFAWAQVAYWAWTELTLLAMRVALTGLATTFFEFVVQVFGWLLAEAPGAMTRAISAIAVIRTGMRRIWSAPSYRGRLSGRDSARGRDSLPRWDP